jgi:lipoprotein-anchoring transpeptidase ErfK/SrfK
MKRAGLVLSLLVACAAAGALAALAFADIAPPGTTSGTTGTTTGTVATTTTTATTETTTTGTTTTAPAPVLAPGVKIGGVRVGGLAPADASAAVLQAFAEPIVLRFGTTTITVAPELLGAAAAVNRALSRAQNVGPNTFVPLNVTVHRAKIAEFVGKLAARFDREPVDARLFLRRFKPVVTPSKPGRSLDVKRATALIATELAANRRTPITLTAKAIPPNVSSKSFSAIIVIKRSSNLLSLYRGMHLVKQFGVATGQSVYPTPLGRFEIIVKWKNPWWYPPNSPWAKGEQPVPPGPGNPLGTRWMGISSPGVGIHGTPDAASIGYSASHGCIRMLIPEAEWLFEHVDIGSPVFIVAA